MSFFWRRLLALPGRPSASRTAEMYFSCIPVLETDDLILRKARRDDRNDIFTYASDPEVSRFVLWEPHRTPAETARFIRTLRFLYREALPSSWAVTLRETGKVIGTIGFVWYSAENRSAELGYSFSRKYWNHGYATQALRAVIASAFSSLNLDRIEAQHDIRNPASGRVMQKCGLRQEGILRDRIRNKGEAVSVALYAILHTDWEAAQR